MDPAPLGGGQQGGRGGQPADPQRVGGQSDQCVGPGLWVGAGTGERAAVPVPRPVVPAELPQQRCLGTVRQGHQRRTGRSAQLGQLGEGRGVATLTAGGHGTQPPLLVGPGGGQRPLRRCGAERGGGQVGHG